MRKLIDGLVGDYIVPRIFRVDVGNVFLVFGRICAKGGGGP